MRIENLDPQTPNTNPFTEDAFHMGTRLGNNVMIMHKNHPDEHAHYLIIVNITTGERIKVVIDCHIIETIRVYCVKKILKMSGHIIEHNTKLETIRVYCVIIEEVNESSGFQDIITHVNSVWTSEESANRAAINAAQRFSVHGTFGDSSQLVRVNTYNEDTEQLDENWFENGELVNNRKNSADWKVWIHIQSRVLNSNY